MTDSAPQAPQNNEAFAEVAPVLSDLGLIVFPVLGPDGKKPLLHSWQKLRRPLGRQAIERFVTRFPGANIGIATGASRLTVVDLDDRAQEAIVIRRFGPTPLIVETPRGGLHLYYCNDGEGCREFRPEGLAVDLKGRGGFVVAPPSVRIGGVQAGKRYRFKSGSWADLPELPAIKPGSLRRDGAIGLPIARTHRVKEGSRNKELFRLLLQDARHCDEPAALFDRAVWLNESMCEPPLPHGELEKLVKQVWNMEESGNNWAGRGVYDAISRNAREEMKHHQHGEDALSLYLELRAAHFDRSVFAIAPKAMAEAKIFPRWGPRRYRNALAALIELGRLRRVHEGGRCKGDPHLYAWARG